MANPQPTDAHLRMAHSINEAIMQRDFTKHQRKILDLILRLSWGCGKKFAFIPFQRDFQVVGIFEGDIKKDLRWLEISKIIFREGNYYWFNKNFDEWQISRVNPFMPERLSELLSLNLSSEMPSLSDLLSNHPELSETLSGRFGKHEAGGSENTKSATPELASSKEILNKDIYNIYTDHNLVNKKEAGEIWLKTLSELEKSVSRSNYRTWFSKTSGLGYHDGRIVIEVPNLFTFEYLSKNQHSLVEKSLAIVMGQPIDFIFHVGKLGGADDD